MLLSPSLGATAMNGWREEPVLQGQSPKIYSHAGAWSVALTIIRLDTL